MRTLLALMLGAGTLAAASIKGTVVERVSGHPLVRTLVVAQPLPGTSGEPKSARTNLSGVFQIDGLPVGSYLVSAARRGFAPVEYGQKRWGAAGLPVKVTEDEPSVIDFRVPHFGAISGKITDENHVGLPALDVVVYRDSRPLTQAARGVTDDRGIYRIFGLEPGLYLVRSLTKTYDDGSYVPTYYNDVAGADEASPVQVTLEEDSPDINIRAVPGQLFTIAGQVSVPFGSGPVQVMLVSDTGTQSVGADSGAFSFPPQAPGKYEIFATASAARNSGPLAAYRPFNLDRNFNFGRIALAQLPTVSFKFVDSSGAPLDQSKVKVLVRRHTLAGASASEILRLTDGAAQLEPGLWDFALAPSKDTYALSFNGAPGAGWNPVVVSERTELRFGVATNPASIHGIVTGASGSPIAGVSVFLEPYDLPLARRMAPVQSTRTDAAGQYKFTGLGPGQYRLLSTFEFQMARPEDLQAAQTPLLALEAGKDASQNLELFVLR